MHQTSIVAAAALLGLLTQTATAAVWGFGDSNIDSGWFTTAPYSGEPKFDTYLSQAALYGVGRQTNNPGPMSIEVLAATLRATAIPANRPGGTNYATSGAKNVTRNMTTDGFPNAVPTVTQINTFLATHQIAAPDVVLIDSGANDINYAVTLTLTEQRVYLQNQAMALANAIQLLQAHGATHIIVTNQPEDFGETKDRDARQIYDAALRASLDAAKVIYVWGDRNDVRHRIVATPSQFNMMYTDNNAAHTACPDGQATFQTDWALVCSANVPGDMPGPNAQKTLFADNGHWASNGQKVLGAYYICLVRANWPGLIQPLAPPQPYPCTSVGITLPPSGPPVIIGGIP